MGKYRRSKGVFMLVPYLPEENFANTDGDGEVQALPQNCVLPYSLVTGDLPIILPERTDVEGTGVGQGRNPGVILSSQFKPGAGSIPNVALPLMMIPHMPGKKTVTHSEAEEWTIEAAAPDNIDESSSFCFDVLDGNKDVIKYQAWFDTTGSASEPDAEGCYDPVDGTDDGVHQSAEGKRDLEKIDISGDSTAQDVSDTIQSALDAITGMSATNTDTTVTVTNDNNGAVMNAFDVDSGLTIETTVEGITGIEVELDPDTDELEPYFGLFFQRDNGDQDTIYDITGCSIATHNLAVAEGEGDGGIMKEDVNYMTAAVRDQYGDLTLLSKPRGPFGEEWTKNLTSFHQQHNNHSWATANKHNSLTYDGEEIDAVWFGWEVSIEHALKHDYDGNGKFASDVSHNKRDVAIHVDVQPEGNTLYEMQRLHVHEYDGDLALQVKSVIPGTDDEVYVQFECDKCRLLPFSEVSKADAEPEQYDIELHPAPGATIKYTIQTYIPSYYFGLGGK